VPSRRINPDRPMRPVEASVVTQAVGFPTDPPHRWLDERQKTSVGVPTRRPTPRRLHAPVFSRRYTVFHRPGAVAPSPALLRTPTHLTAPPRRLHVSASWTNVSLGITAAWPGHREGVLDRRALGVLLPTPWRW